MKVKIRGEIHIPIDTSLKKNVHIALKKQTKKKCCKTVGISYSAVKRKFTHFAIATMSWGWSYSWIKIRNPLKPKSSKIDIFMIFLGNEFCTEIGISRCDDSEQFPTLCSRFRMGLLKLFAFLIKDLNNSLKNYLKPKNPWTNFLKIPVQDGNYLPSLTTLYVTNVGNIRPREITTIIWTELHDKRKSPRIKVKVKFSFQVQSLCLLMSLVVSQFLITGFCFFSHF